ncbi:hypothetical protein EPN87_03355 [archaeon]|nr:MAG: hypothetical protein EPN87_03355 [archaeon]
MASRFGVKQPVIIIILSLLAVAVWAFPRNASVADNVNALYELSNPGSTAEVISLTEDSGLYKAVVKVTGPSGTSFAEAWVTKDGRYLTQSVIFVQDSIRQIETGKNFVDCLHANGLRIYGVTNQSTQAGVATLMQLNTLGVYAPKIFVSCDGDLLPNCLTAGITQAPTTVYNNTGYPGVLTISQLANLTSCKQG